MRIVITGAVVLLVIAAIVLPIVFIREGVVVKSGKISRGLSYVKVIYGQHRQVK